MVTRYGPTQNTRRRLTFVTRDSALFRPVRGV